MARCAAVLVSVAAAEVPGFASGTVGGGDATPIVPSSLEELESLLKDDSPRVIHLDRTFDFRGSMGRDENAAGCIPENQMNRPECDAGGQPALSQSFWNCDGKNPITVSYDIAGTVPLTVTGQKTIRGLGRQGRIVGRGLLLRGQQIIVQNLHITELNHHLIWGGDAIYIADPSDYVWIDHVTFSKIGRQMTVTDTSVKSRITISNCDYDGNTDHSATCDGRHYWTLLFYGQLEYITFFNNYVHSTSGRSPKLGRDADHTSILHASNNMFHDNSGHCFDASHGGHALVERNVFRDVNTAVLQDEGELGLVVSDSPWMCRGRSIQCRANLAQGSTAALSETTLASIGQGSPFDWAEVRQGCQNLPDVESVASYSLLTDANWGVGVMDSSSQVLV